MKQIERNLLTSAMIVYDEAEDLVKLFKEQPESKYAEMRMDSAINKITIAQTFIKALKMITCTHNNGKGDTTGVAWHQTFDGNEKQIQSYKEVTRRCDDCKQVFYRKKYNLLKRKKNART